MAAKVEPKNGTTTTKIKMGFKGGTCFPMAGLNGTVDTTPELHLKMSKKIAQLTKVIYSLNTKNEEHDDIFQSMREVHEEEMQKLASESKDKIAHYRQKLELVKEQELLIKGLQDLLSEEQKEKQNFIDDFEKFKREKSKEKNEYETQFKQNYVSKFKEISVKFTDLKTEFENRTKQFETKKGQIENERDNVVSKLTHAHSLETEKLIKAHRVRYDELQKGKTKSEENYESLLSANKSGSNNFILEKSKLEKEFNEKLEKMKGFYEKELEVLSTREQESINEKSKELNDKLKLSNIQHKRSEDELRSTIKIIKDENNAKKEEIISLEQNYKNVLDELKRTSDFQNITLRLKQELSEITEKLRDSDAMLITFKQRCEEQVSELIRKSAETGTLEATRLSNEQSMRDLHLEIKRLLSICKDMEKEKDLVNKKLSSHSNETSSQIQFLQKEMDRISKEKEGVVSKYEKLLTTAKEKQDQQLEKQRTKSKLEIQKLEETHEIAINNLKRTILTENNDTFQELTDKFLKKQEDLENQNKSALSRKDGEIKQIERQLMEVNNEVERLQKENNDHQKRLGSTSSHVLSLEEKLDKAKRDLFKTMEELSAAKVKIRQYEDQQLTLQSEHIKKLQEAEEKLRSKQQDLTEKQNKKWAERLKKECQDLRSEMSCQYKEDNRAALEKLNSCKEKEYEALKKLLQIEITNLQKTILKLRKDLEQSVNNDRNSAANHIEAMNQQRKKYEEEIAKEKYEHNTEIQKLKELMDEKIGKLAEQYNCDVNDLELKLRSEHQDDMVAQLHANKAAIEGIKSQYEQKKKEEMNELQTNHMREKDVLRESLYIQHQEEVEQVTQHLDMEIAVMKGDLERSKELRKKEFDIHTSKIDGLVNTISNKEEFTKRLEQEFIVKDNEISQLRKELEAKVEEIRSIRREANIQQRKREQQLAKQHRDELDSLTADHLRETQGILAEFNRTKELLKDKISALQIMLEQAEDKFRARASRTEDIETIQALKRGLTERELECRQLVEDKRYFQLELLNRETNFNKVFNSNPTVGVINPLAAGKKRKKAKQTWNSAGSRRYPPNSASSSPARLDPLPNLQLHEQRLNSSKPLPGAPVKGH